MIEYDPGHWGLFFIFRCKGSVFPKAIAVAIPHTVLTVLLHMFWVTDMYANPMEGLDIMWGGFTSVLSFLLIFRNNQAYTRFWEGATLIYQVRGEWFNAVSALFAFCSRSRTSEPQVRQFQHNLVRLASLLYCSALQQVCDLGDDCLEVLEVLEFDAIDKDALAFLKASNDRCEVILQWMQRLIVDANDQETLDVAPPLLTRAFQELSRGMVNLNNARKIQDIPFPFPYAQLITCMLMAHWLVTPFIIANYVKSIIVAATGSFLVTFFVWCLVYINMELDQPFGEDTNDLSLHSLQTEFNQSLVTLMHPLAQQVPKYRDTQEEDDGETAKPTPSFLMTSSMTQMFTTAAADAENQQRAFMDVVAKSYNALVYIRRGSKRLTDRLRISMLFGGSERSDEEADTSGSPKRGRRGSRRGSHCEPGYLRKVSIGTASSGSSASAGSKEPPEAESPPSAVAAGHPRADGEAGRAQPACSTDDFQVDTSDSEQPVRIAMELQDRSGWLKKIQAGLVGEDVRFYPVEGDGEVRMAIDLQAAHGETSRWSWDVPLQRGRVSM